MLHPPPASTKPPPQHQSRELHKCREGLNRKQRIHLRAAAAECREDGRESRGEGAGRSRQATGTAPFFQFIFHWAAIRDSSSLLVDAKDRLKIIEGQRTKRVDRVQSCSRHMQARGPSLGALRRRSTRRHGTAPGRARANVGRRGTLFTPICAHLVAQLLPLEPLLDRLLEEVLQLGARQGGSSGQGCVKCRGQQATSRGVPAAVQRRGAQRLPRAPFRERRQGGGRRLPRRSHRRRHRLPLQPPLRRCRGLLQAR